jgi:hypothetical protein
VGCLRLVEKLLDGFKTLLSCLLKHTSKAGQSRDCLPDRKMHPVPRWFSAYLILVGVLTAIGVVKNQCTLSLEFTASKHVVGRSFSTLLVPVVQQDARQRVFESGADSPRSVRNVQQFKRRKSAADKPKIRAWR